MNCAKNYNIKGRRKKLQCLQQPGRTKVEGANPVCCENAKIFSKEKGKPRNQVIELKEKNMKKQN